MVTAPNDQETSRADRALLPLLSDTALQAEITNFLSIYNPTATPEELTHFAVVCSTYKVSPMRNQIYLVSRYDSTKRRMVATPQISIGGLRALALRSREYEGTTEPQWGDEEGNWYTCWPKRLGKHPYAARIGVYRRGFRAPVWGVVYFDERAQYKSDKTLTNFWQNKGLNMLIKCAEAAGLRGAFEEQCGGLYIHEEMNAADENTPYIKIMPEPGEAERSDEPALAETASKARPAASVKVEEVKDKAPAASDQSVRASSPRPAASQPVKTASATSQRPRQASARKEPLIDLANIPTVGLLKRDVAALNLPRRGGGIITWSEFVGKSLGIKEQALADVMAREFTPGECAKIYELVRFYQERQSQNKATQETPAPAEAAQETPASEVLAEAAPQAVSA